MLICCLAFRPYHYIVKTSGWTNYRMLKLTWIVGCKTLKMSFWKTVSTALVGLLFSREACYNEEGIGCFSNKKPYNNAQGLLPQLPSKMQVYVPNVPVYKYNFWTLLTIVYSGSNIF